MADFVVRLDPTYGALPPALKLVVNRYRSSIFGGPESCEIVSASSPTMALWETLGYVFRGLEIYNDFGTLVWWGLVNSVVVNTDGLAVGVTLDGMYNRIMGVYSFTEANGATDAGATAWQEDANSIGIYGRKELLMTVGEADEAATLAEIEHLFDNGVALPQRIRSISSEGQNTKLGGIGWWETLRWKYFKRLEGRWVWLGNNGTQYTQNIGWGVTSSNRIGFAVGSLYDIDARIGALQVDDKVVVSGSVSNNKVLTIAERANGAKQVYTANTIRFEPTDDILDSASGLGFVEADNFIQVQGSVLHSRYHLIDTTGADHITVAYTVTGALSNEAAGPSITLTQGQRAVTHETVANEVPGASVTLTQYGYKIAMRFTPDHGFTLDKIALSVGKVGNPVDNLQVTIYSDVFGQPGVAALAAVLGAGSIATQPTWTWFTFTPATLAFVASTAYWLVIERTGALSATDYFTLRMIAESNGSCLAWNGSAWVTHPQIIDGVGVTVPYQIWGAEDTLLQLKRVITEAGQWFAGIDDRVGATGRLLNQYVEVDLQALDVAEDLIAKGMSDGRRIFVTVTPERMVRIEAEPTTPDLVDRWMRNGKIGGAVGGMRERGVLPVGEWLALEAVPVAVNSVLAISPAMVDAAEYSPPTDELNPEFKSLDVGGQG